MIREAREAAGLHVAALAVSMKIPVKKLEALEADRLDLLHDAVFVRALAASVCRALKIDPAPVLSKLPLNKTPQLSNDERGINAPFQAPSGAAGLSWVGKLANPYALLVIALVIAAIVVKFVPGIRLPEWAPEDTPQAAKSADTPEPPVVEHTAPDAVVTTADANSATTNVPNLTTRPPEPVVVPVPVVTAASEAAPPKALVVEPSVAASRPAAPVAVASKPASAVAMAASQPSTGASRPAVAASRPASAPALPTTGMVVFKAKGPTWVKVTDAKGIVQLSKMLANGDVVGASGTAPLAVVVGRVDVTEVEVHGKAYPLTTTSKENVARFEVK